MPTLRIMTFNVENLLVRFKFREFEKESLATLLDTDTDADRANLIRTYWNVLNDENRVATSLNMREADPEVICMQEVENLHSLESFHDRYVRRISGQNYAHKILIEGNDPRGIDVAVLSRFTIDSITSHREMEGPDHKRIFRRECLEIHVKKQNKALPVFVCHFKSMSGGRAQTRPIRLAEAGAVRKILIDRFGDPAKHDWLVVGDLNDYTETDGTPDKQHALGALLDKNFSVDLVKRIQAPLDRWTHFFAGENSYHQIDYMLASPSLAAKNPNAVPRIIRQGQPYRAERYQGPRWPRIGFDRPKASDHCSVVVDLKF